MSWVSTAGDPRRLAPGDHPADHTSREEAVAALVADLRELWIESGSPKFAALSARTGLSKSTLNDAVTRTNRLPSRRVVAAMVGVLAPDEVDAWLARRARVVKGEPAPTPAPATAGAPPASIDDPPSSSGGDDARIEDDGPAHDEAGTPPSDTPRRRTWKRPTWLATALIAVTCALLASAVTWAVFGRGSPTVVAAPLAPGSVTVSDGDDPNESLCMNDARIAASETHTEGTLKLVYSPACQSYWARVERLDGRAIGNRVAVQVYQLGDKNRMERAADPNVRTTYTGMLVRRDRSDTMCAAAWVYVGKRQVVIGDDIC